MSNIRYAAYVLIVFAALCWIGAAWVGISYTGGEINPDALRTLDMFSAVATTSSLLAIALGIWFKN